MKSKWCSLLPLLYSIIFMFITTNLTAQDYYPLEIGNRWDYEVWYSSDNIFKTTSNYSIEVISDSMFSNGKTYYVLSDFDLSGGRYVRADNDFVYYYDEISSEEDTLYHLNANIGDFWELQFGPTSYISVEAIDTTELFTFSSRVMKFRLDGLILKYVNLSDLFGPSYFYFPGEPPGTSNTIKILIGGIISGVEFGDPSSAGQDSDSELNSFALSQNYPNPFNPYTIISFSIPYDMTNSNVELSIYDITGRLVKTLVNENLPAGNYLTKWEGDNTSGSKVSSGVYIYSIRVGDRALNKKMTLLK